MLAGVLIRPFHHFHKILDMNSFRKGRLIYLFIYLMVSEGSACGHLVLHFSTHVRQNNHGCRNIEKRRMFT